MSAKKCSREECGKTVYPIEELKCLDKVWHKQCFKCTVCGMTLSMKNYKGYDKKPYCEPHYPKTVASVVTDTPEMRRLAENTKNQSQVKYHEDYEKMRGTRIQIADDPEMARHLANSRVQSQAQYHGELEKKLHQDSHRPREEAGGGGSDGQSSNASSTLGLSSQGVISDPSYYTSHSRQGSSSNGQPQQQTTANGYYTVTSGYYQHQPSGYDHQRMTHSMINGGFGSDNFGQANHTTVLGHSGHQQFYANGVRQTAAPMSMSQSVYATQPPYHATSKNSRQSTAVDSPVERLADRVDAMTSPLSGPDGLSPYSQRLTSQQAGTIVFSSEANGRVPAQERNIGSIADYDPLNGQWGGGAQTATGAAQFSQKSPASGAVSSAVVGGGDAAKKGTMPKAGKGITVKALYDYTAADTDEVSFLENDIIVNCEKVDDGWMTGTVQRTLQYGMLPANYVERINAPIGLHRLH